MAKRYIWVLVIMAGLLGTPTQAELVDQTDERFWISREVLGHGFDNCRDGDCPRVSEYTTRLFDPYDDDRLRRLMALLDFQSSGSGQTDCSPRNP